MNDDNMTYTGGAATSLKWEEFFDNRRNFLLTFISVHDFIEMVVDSRNSDSRRRGRSHHVTYICNGGSLSCCLFVSALCLVFSSVASGFKQMGVNERGSVRTAKFMDCGTLQDVGKVGIWNNRSEV